MTAYKHPKKRAALILAGISAATFLLTLVLYSDLPDWLRTDLPGDGMLAGLIFLGGTAVAAVLLAAAGILWWLASRNPAQSPE